MIETVLVCGCVCFVGTWCAAVLAYNGRPACIFHYLLNVPCSCNSLRARRCCTTEQKCFCAGDGLNKVNATKSDTSKKSEKSEKKSDVTFEKRSARRRRRQSTKKVPSKPEVSESYVINRKEWKRMYKTIPVIPVDGTEGNESVDSEKTNRIPKKKHRFKEKRKKARKFFSCKCHRKTAVGTSEPLQHGCTYPMLAFMPCSSDTKQPNVSYMKLERVK